MKFDTKQEGLLTLFKPHQAVLMEHIWDLNENERVGIISAEAHQFLSGKPEKKSRASVINFLNDMVDGGVLNYTEKPGKGGYHRIYFPAFDEEGFKRHVAKAVISKLSDTWPDATREALTASRKV